VNVVQSAVTLEMTVDQTVLVVVLVVCVAVGLCRRHTMASSVHVRPTPPNVAELTLHDSHDSDSDITTDTAAPLNTTIGAAAVTASSMSFTHSFMACAACSGLFRLLSRKNYTSEGDRGT